jgi:hypothetical protein
MSSFYSDASLVLIPSGYKDQKVYSAVPTDGSGDLSFTRASTATRVNSSGLIEAVASGVPRLDYLNSTCPKLLLEPQRTNLALYSEQFDNAEYTADNASFTANATASPDGTINADLLTENSSAATHGFYAPVVARGTTGANLTTSIFAKSNGRRYINISGGFDSSNYYNAVFDLQNGVVSTTGNSGAGTSPVASIVSYGNGWYRCIVTGSVTGLPNRLSFIYLSNSTTGNGVGGATYTGNGTSGAYFYGLQIEDAAYATSYIPTTTAAVTRVADAASKTGISSLIGQTEGTIFAEINLAKLLGIQSRYILVISDNTANNRIYIAFSGSSSNILRARIFSAGVQQISIDTATISSLGKYKLALAYNNNDAVLYVNGVQIGTDTSVTIPACSQLNVCTNQAGASPFDDGINQTLLFKTRLTNSQLQELTSL